MFFGRKGNKSSDGRFLKIDKLYAFISKDENGNEGIMGARMAMGMMPLIGADLARVESLKPIAEKIKKETGINYEIRYFEVKK